ncbi:hypothetical protein KDA14_05310, partial [Candidatus Saccharibacteria bacterium]|nr:hypothetical protein [Candidatus Saccharibacteria bacterium]
MVFREARLDITTSPVAIVYDLRDTQHDTYYAYTPFHASNFDFTGDTKASVKCGAIKRQKTQKQLETSLFEDELGNAMLYNRQCWPWHYERIESITSYCRSDATGTSFARTLVDCAGLDDTTNHAYGWTNARTGFESFSERIRSQYCRFPYPNLEANVDRYGLIESDEKGYYRFKMRSEAKDFECQEDDEADNLTAYPYPEHSSLAPSDNSRCQLKYGILSDASPCSQWSGTFYDTFPTEIRRSWDPSSFDAGQILDTVDNDASGNKDFLLTESRPVLAGCPGPFYGNNRYLLPRRPDADARVNTDSLSRAVPNPDFPEIDLPYPTIGQCTNNDKTCCDAKLFSNDPRSNGDPFYPFATCNGVSRATAQDLCPARLASYIKKNGEFKPNNADKIMSNTDGMGFLYPQC